MQTFVQRIVVKGEDFFSSTCKETFFHGYFAQNVVPLKTLGLGALCFWNPKDTLTRHNPEYKWVPKRY